MTSPDAALRAKKVAQVTALLLKTEANGCSAEEALASREMADRLMAKYSITEAECQPQTRRSSFGGSSDWFSDFLRNYAGQTQQEAQADQRQANARAQYHRNGVHLDDNSFAEDCQCRSCKAARNPYTAPRPSANCDCDDCTGRNQARRDQARQEPRSGRRNTSHAGCYHENTKAARARCRREGGPWRS